MFSKIIIRKRFGVVGLWIKSNMVFNSLFKYQIRLIYLAYRKYPFLEIYDHETDLGYSIYDIKPHEQTVPVPKETDINISLFTVSEILYREYMSNPNFKKDFELKDIIEDIKEYRQRSYRKKF